MSVSSSTLNHDAKPTSEPSSNERVYKALQWLATHPRDASLGRRDGDGDWIMPAGSAHLADLLARLDHQHARDVLRDLVRAYCVEFSIFTGRDEGVHGGWTDWFAILSEATPRHLDLDDLIAQAHAAITPAATSPSEVPTDPEAKAEVQQREAWKKTRFAEYVQDRKAEGWTITPLPTADVDRAVPGEVISLASVIVHVTSRGLDNLRRRTAQQRPEPETGLVIHEDCSQVWWNGVPLPIINKHSDFKLLQCLYTSVNKIVMHLDLLLAIDPGALNDKVESLSQADLTVKDCIVRIRAAFKKVKCGWTIVPVRGTGYILQSPCE